MDQPTPNASLLGRTIRWTFSDGAMAGRTFDHTFNADGTVVWRSVDGDAQGRLHQEKFAGIAPLGDAVAVVSYRSASGHTLTVALHFADMRLVAFASNGESWSQQSGSFEVLSPPA